MAISSEIEKLEKTAYANLKPYPNAGWRENIEVLLVAVADLKRLSISSVPPQLLGCRQLAWRHSPWEFGEAAWRAAVVRSRIINLKNIAQEPLVHVYFPPDSAAVVFPA